MKLLFLFFASMNAFGSFESEQQAYMQNYPELAIRRCVDTEDSFYKLSSFNTIGYTVSGNLHSYVIDFLLLDYNISYSCRSTVVLQVSGSGSSFDIKRLRNITACVSGRGYKINRDCSPGRFGGVTLPKLSI